MREIKFRAWDGINKKMIYGETPDNPSSSWVLALPDEIIKMQYTGRRDKNGKEIYEGDIIAGDYISADNSMGVLPNGWTFDKDKDRFLVIFDNELGGWSFKFEDDTSYSEDYYNKYKFHAREMLIMGWGEVLGNMYENPKLLEKE